MKNLRTLLTALTLLCSTFLIAPQAQAELLAAKDSARLVSLTPLRNGTSAVTLAWSMARQTQQDVFAYRSALLSILSAGVDGKTAFEAENYRSLLGMRVNVSFENSYLMLTVTSPNESFPDAIVHLAELMKKDDFSMAWYNRSLESSSPTPAAITRRPRAVVAALDRYLSYPDLQGADLAQRRVRFGMPQHVIARAENATHIWRVQSFVRALPRAQADAASDSGKPAPSNRPTSLPRGTLYIADISASEMMIMLVKSHDFARESDQIAANILTDYIGGSQGSEMFKIIRQELRAAYNPSSTFEVLGKNKAISAYSATVAADEWPTLLERMKQIYSETKAGTVTQTGLKYVLSRLNRHFGNQFSTNAVWGVRNYLRQYPNGASGQITLPLFQAVVDADTAKIAQNTDRHLPDIEEYLLILIGGGAPPSAALRANGYCTQTFTQPLSVCLEQLSQAQN